MGASTGGPARSWLISLIFGRKAGIFQAARGSKSSSWLVIEETEKDIAVELGPGLSGWPIRV